MTAEQTWREFSDPKFALRFAYPEFSPQGHPTEVKESVFANAVRIHLMSPEKKEIYFEVTRYPKLLPEQSYEQLKEEVENRFGASVSLLTPSTFMGFPAFEMHFEWSVAKRFVIFFPKDGSLYRILYDPTSALNLQIRSTLEFL